MTRQTAKPSFDVMVAYELEHFGVLTTTLVMGLSTDGSGRQCKLTYPNIVAEPGEVLLGAVVVTDLLIAATCRRARGKEAEGVN